MSKKKNFIDGVMKKKNFIDEYGYRSSLFARPIDVISDSPQFQLNSVDEMLYNPKSTFYYPIQDMPAPIEPVYEEPIFNPPALPIYDIQPMPIDDLIYDLPKYQPIDEQPYIPKFPNYSMMNCSELQVEINSLNQTLMTSRMVSELRAAYEQALSNAQDVYILNCGENRIEPVPCPDLPLAAPPAGMKWISIQDEETGCPRYELVNDGSASDVEIGIGTGTGSGSTGTGSGTGSGSTGTGSTGTGSGFVDDTTSPIKTQVPDAQSNPTFVDDKKAVLPTKAVSKNLQPYIYAGIGIVVILIVSRMLTKKD
jgi:hypothetical protein